MVLGGKNQGVQAGVILCWEAVVGTEGGAIIGGTITEDHVDGSALVAGGLGLVDLFHVGALGTGAVIFTNKMMLGRWLLHFIVM